MLLVYVFPNHWLGGIQIHRYTSFYASMAEGFMHQTLNLAIRVRVPMEVPQKVLRIVCKAVIKDRLRTKPYIFNIAEAVWWSHTRLITLVVEFNSHFRNYSPLNTYNLGRYSNLAQRLLTVELKLTLRGHT